MSIRTAANKEPEYLGDGVYASHDGYHVWLDQRGEDERMAIALEPDVFRRLIEYRDRHFPQEQPE